MSIREATLMKVLKIFLASVIVVFLILGLASCYMVGQIELIRRITERKAQMLTHKWICVMFLDVKSKFLFPPL